MLLGHDNIFYIPTYRHKFLFTYVRYIKMVKYFTSLEIAAIFLQVLTPMPIYSVEKSRQNSWLPFLNFVRFLGYCRAGGAASKLLKNIVFILDFLKWHLSILFVLLQILIIFIQKVVKLWISYKPKISKSNNGKFPSWCRRLLMKFFNWQEAKGESTIPSSTPSLHLCQFAWWYRGLLLHC